MRRFSSSTDRATVCSLLDHPDRVMQQVAPEAMVRVTTASAAVHQNSRSTSMASEPSARTNPDIRDSVPDWSPYLPPKAPDGAPNVLYITWDDLGYGTMDV